MLGASPRMETDGGEVVQNNVRFRLLEILRYSPKAIVCSEMYNMDM